MADEEVTVEEGEILSAKEVARLIGTDARTFRKFMRSALEPDEQPGQGGRYQIDAEDVPAIKKAFDKWSKPSKNGTKIKKTKIVEDDEIVDLTDDEDFVDEDDSDDDETVDLEDIEIVE